MAVTAAACNSPAAAGVSPTPTASPSAARHETPQPSAAIGSIEGAVSYPADVLLAQAVYAVATDGSRSYHVETVGFGRGGLVGRPWGDYKLLGVAPGDYFVVTAVRDLLSTTDENGASTGVLITASTRTTRSTRFDAGYTKAVLCGLKYGCNDHKLVPVHVTAGAVTGGINPEDWNVGDPNFYPLIPGGGPLALSLGPAPVGFQDLGQAAIYYSQLHTSARYGKTSDGCQINLACLWFADRQNGHAAAYFTAEVGTNGLFRMCTFYLYRTGSGWHYFDSNCRRPQSPFPAIGASGKLALGFGGTGCINIHSAPGASTKVVDCRPEGTPIRIDGGPYYLAEKASSLDFGTNYWWHIANRGWVVHRYVMYSA